MAGNFVISSASVSSDLKALYKSVIIIIIVADFCDRARPFLKFEKNRYNHIAARKLQFRFQFGSALKRAVFSFGLKTVTALLFFHCLPLRMNSTL